MSSIQPLLDYLREIPGLATDPHTGTDAAGRWWVRFSVSLAHPLGRRVLLRLTEAAHALCLREHLPALFYPVAVPAADCPVPECLGWAFQAKDRELAPAVLAAALRARLPRATADW